MLIRCWGSRGAIPVSGAEYLRYGGDTTCLEIRSSDGETIIVDAGTGIRRLGNRMVEENRLHCHLLFTHAHWDHVMGFPFFKPIFIPSAKLVLYNCPLENCFVETILSEVMSPPTFPVRYAELKARIDYRRDCPTNFTIGDITIHPVPLSHPNSGTGYKFTENGRSFVFLTDNELGFVHPKGLDFEGYRDFCSGADLLIHDAEYTPEEYRSARQWGHSVFTDVVALATKARVRRLGLFHLNQDRTDDDMDAIVAASRKLIAEAGADIDCFGVAAGMVLEV
ncbi:MAG TPA: MBL fold metallo-hydrolase [Desulfobacteraceae bacterium]|nr:MBL fold metallo-hydrolase [Deltaproteobacteria bacterium]HDI61151.1 MBL fold metallo-hydrolase [Desulfobacteraceae bacterium]